MNVRGTGRPNAHDNNLLDIKGISLWLDYRFVYVRCLAEKFSLACEVEVRKSFSVLYNSTQI